MLLCFFEIDCGVFLCLMGDFLYFCLLTGVYFGFSRFSESLGLSGLLDLYLIFWGVEADLLRGLGVFSVISFRRFLLKVCLLGPEEFERLYGVSVVLFDLVFVILS